MSDGDVNASFDVGIVDVSLFIEICVSSVTLSAILRQVLTSNYTIESTCHVGIFFFKDDVRIIWCSKRFNGITRIKYWTMVEICSEISSVR